MSLYTRSLDSEDGGIIRSLSVQIFRAIFNICVYKSSLADLVSFPTSCREAQNRYIEIRMIFGSFGVCTLLERPFLFSSFSLEDYFSLHLEAPHSATFLVRKATLHDELLCLPIL